MSEVRTLPPLAAYALALGDDALILAQRLGEWVACAPQIEEDVALANIALDLLGQARTLLSHAGAVEGAGRDEDDLAYLRDDRDFRNVQLVEIPNGDFAVTMARQLVFSAYQYELYTALQGSDDRPWPGWPARRSRRSPTTVTTPRSGCCGSATARTCPTRVCRPDSTRCGRTPRNSSTPPASRASCRASRPTRPRCGRPGTLRGLGPGRGDLRPPEPRWRSRGGRDGLHTEHLGHLLAEMQHLHRSHPGATW